MPRAENNEEHVVSSDEPWSLSGDRDFLEYGQRHGLLEDERIVSGGKRICFCRRNTSPLMYRNCWIFFLTMMYPLLTLFGFYAGYISNCDCDGS